MSVLFLDPLVLVAYVCLLVYAWTVWRGSLRWWFGRDAVWSVVAWPLPAVTATAPVVVSALTALADVVGVGRGDGGLVTTVVYLAAGVLPWTLGCVLPPRWLLPRWARERLVEPPSRLLAPVEGAVAAVHAPRGRGHGSRARWAWRVDGVPGFVWVVHGTLRFRSLDDLADPDPEPDPGSSEGTDDGQGSPAAAPRGEAASRGVAPGGGDGPDAPHDEPGEGARGGDEDLFGRIARELGFERPGPDGTAGPEVRHTPDAVDVDLTAVEAWGVRSRRPWRPDGLLTLRVTGKARPVTVWVADLAATRSMMRAATGARSAGTR